MTVNDSKRKMTVIYLNDVIYTSPACNVVGVWRGWRQLQLAINSEAHLTNSTISYLANN